jgi:serine/threonine-protein kinase
MIQAESLAEKALELNSRLAEGHLILGHVFLAYHWDWKGAEEAYRKALELDPSSAMGYFAYSFLATIMGKPSEGLSYAETAKRLDPIGTATNLRLAFSLADNNRYDEAESVLLDFLEFDPGNQNTYWGLGLLYTLTEQYEKAISNFQKQISLMAGQNVSDEVAQIAIAYALSGRREDAKRYLGQLVRYAKQHYVSPAIFAHVHAAIGDTETAFRLLDEAFQQKDHRAVFICLSNWFPKGFPAYDSFRSDPRFEQLLRKLNLPEEAIQKHLALPSC